MKVMFEKAKTKIAQKRRAVLERKYLEYLPQVVCCDWLVPIYAELLQLSHDINLRQHLSKREERLLAAALDSFSRFVKDRPDRL